MLNILRPYQQEIACAISRSVFNKSGLTFCVEIARQGGKNELSAQLEALLLARSIGESKNLVKCSPTFRPQALISSRRLQERLMNDPNFAGNWSIEMGYIIRVGRARAFFLSADRYSNVVGHTAHILLEVDEAQDVSKEKYTKEFKPMGATTNVTTVLYGTTWDDSTLLEETKQTCLELEKKDGTKRYFRYDWQEAAKYNPDYLAYVESERERLGEDHPLFRTQYRLLPVRGGGGFLSSQQMAQLQGDHPRKHGPQPGRIYVAGIDLAGEAEEEEGAYLKSLKMRQDSTVVTIGELDFGPGGVSKGDALLRQGVSLLPAVKVVEHYSWTGRKHAELYPQLIDILRKVWHCRRVIVDATGVGQPVAAFLKQALGPVIVPFTFTAKSKSELGFNLLAAVNSGRLKMYAGDSSPEYREFWNQIEKARGYYRPSQTMNFYVDPSQGHDDFLMSLALVVEAGNGYERRVGWGR
jgi:hypothetical protein